MDKCPETFSAEKKVLRNRSLAEVVHGAVVEGAAAVVNVRQLHGHDPAQVDEPVVAELPRVVAAILKESRGRCYDHNFLLFLPIFLKEARGRCYDHNHLRFLPIFDEKIGVFIKKS
jgi:hypothetical protein